MIRKQTLAAYVIAVAFLLWSATSSASVTVGHSGWDWGNPLPQGNTINTLEFVGNRGYAAGNFGTVLRTEDGGTSWSGVRTGITPDLKVVRTIGADTLIVGGDCTLRRSDDGGQSFTRLPWTASDLSCSSKIKSFHFPSSSVGYLLLSDGNVFRTANGGQSWSRKTAVPGTKATGGASSPNDIFFTGEDSGFVVTSGGKVYRSTDGGSSWTLNADPGVSIEGIYFADAATGYAVGASGTVLKSTDGGATWDPKAMGLTPMLTAIRCAGATTCLATVSGGIQLLRTSDGGDSWTSVSPSSKPIFAAAFASAARAVAAGVDGSMVVSDDAGVNWSAVGGSLGGTYTGLRATSSTTAYAFGPDGALARTSNGGQSWQSLGVSTAADVVDVSFPGSNVGFALDSSGSAYRSNDSGVSWQVLNTGTSADPNAILALDADRVLLIGPKGVRRSSDGGGHFSSVVGKALSKAKLDDVDRGGSSAFVFGEKALFVSKNGGRSWKKARRPRGRLESVDFVSSKQGYALTTDGRLWHTRNRGKRWRQLQGIGSDQGRIVAFGSAKEGFVRPKWFAGDTNEWLLHTSDGGKTWRPQLLSRDASTGALAAPSGSTAFVTINGFFLFATHTGGDAGAQSTLTIKTKKRKLRKKATIKVTGKLSPADGGERVIVSARTMGSTKWKYKWVEAAANGTFTTTWKVRRTTVFVAQWAGDDDHRGDGSSVLKVRVKKKRKRRRG